MNTLSLPIPLTSPYKFLLPFPRLGCLYPQTFPNYSPIPPHSRLSLCAPVPNFTPVSDNQLADADEFDEEEDDDEEEEAADEHEDEIIAFDAAEDAQSDEDELATIALPTAETRFQRVQKLCSDVREFGDELASSYDFRIDKFQLLAIKAFMRGSSVVVLAPTSSRIPLIAEAVAATIVPRGRRLFYTTPLKALSNQKFREFRETFGESNVGLLTGDSTVNKDAQVLIMTTEILRNMLYQSVGIVSSGSGLFDVDAIVLDEVHYSSDIYRGTVWEEIVIYCPKEVQLICLSATVANPDELAGWISQIHGRTELVTSARGHVPLTWNFSTKTSLFPLLDETGKTLNRSLSLSNLQMHALGGNFSEDNGPKRNEGTKRHQNDEVYAEYGVMSGRSSLSKNDINLICSSQVPQIEDTLIHLRGRYTSEITEDAIDKKSSVLLSGKACKETAVLQEALRATMAAETLINCKEAVIAAAAAEAVALARAAVKFAKDAVILADIDHGDKSEFNSGSEWSGGDSIELDTGLIPGYSMIYPTDKHDDVEPTVEELELLQSQVSESRAVRSTRQVERKAKRAKASEKAAITFPVKVVSNRKKRATAQEVKNPDPLRYLRGSVSGSKLLTATEEQELSVGIQDLLKLEKLYRDLKERGLGEPTFTQWAAAARVDQKTLRSRLTYGTQCKDKMIKSNIRLVISIAKKYQGSGMNLQDLVQEGCRGLVKGAEKFDASKGFKFSTYAHWWIKQAVRKFLTDQSRTIRLPFHMVEATYRVREARKQLYSENGRHPNHQEVAEAAGLSMKRMNAVLLSPKAPRSLDQKFGINESLKPSEVMSHPDAETSEELLIKQFMKVDLEKVLDSLTHREKQVVKWRFGMGDGRIKTLQEIGELMGVSRERIRQIESSAFRKLKNKKRTKHLQQYLFT